ncbi:unnamed protein product [Brachionus calyciflorus]|uniref:Uncharacterized protein n=1 Tax=Brachionus calyciflorus TaxID=104777 RepID=A0A814GDX1_9BILA|nr:unnamed protein product [Brachionus calyciflorus]
MNSQQISIWGLVKSLDENLAEQTKEIMRLDFKNYDENKSDNFYTQKIDWLQMNFNCCGIESYSDWRSYLLTNGQHQSVNYIDQWTINNNLPYIDNVPDSCCLSKKFNCGKMFSSQSSENKNLVINTKGCLNSYLEQSRKHIIFLAGLTVGISALILSSFFIYAFVYFFLRLRD